MRRLTGSFASQRGVQRGRASRHRDAQITTSRALVAKPRSRNLPSSTHLITPDVGVADTDLYPADSAMAAAASTATATATCSSDVHSAHSLLRRYAFPLLLLTFFVLQLIAMLLFTGGFFLTRVELPLTQRCEPPETAQHRADNLAMLFAKRNTASTNGESGADALSAASAASAELSSSLRPASCWYPRQFDRVVILLIDALRFDFLLYNSTEAMAQATADSNAVLGIEEEAEQRIEPFKNGLPVVSAVLHSPATARYSSLFRFEADPPTVTMQRLKGLTTGGLPTFIDIKDNFGSKEVEEDSWVKQLVGTRQGWTSPSTPTAAADANPLASLSAPANRMHFFGDDTWFDLFPPAAYFTPASRAFPSFNVKDLHTVDNGCLQKLEPIVKAEHERIEREGRILDGAPANRDRPNLFVSLRIRSAPVIRELVAVQSALASFDARYASSTVDPASFHITLALLHVDGPGEEAEALRVFSQVQPRLRLILTGSDDASTTTVTVPELSIRGVSTFGQSILYADVARGTSRQRLVAAARVLKDAFRQAGVGCTAETESLEFVPHITLAKLKPGSQSADDLRQFDAASYASFNSHAFGSEAIEALELCSVDAPKDADGYYAVRVRIFLDGTAAPAQSTLPSAANARAAAAARPWDVTLAHFLGVDHVGHRYGPSHAAMRPKLAQMNKVISEQVAWIDAQRELNKRIRAAAASGQGRKDLPSPQEVLLLVLGDHGMTPGGNHGGQSAEEIYAGLFLYATKDIAQTSKAVAQSYEERKRDTDEGRTLEMIRALSADAEGFASAPPSQSHPLAPLATSWQTIPQVDLVPSLSLLLGLPIPFGNVGKIIPELFWGRDGAGQEESEGSGGSEEEQKLTILQRRIISFLPLLDALHLNALQLFQYLSLYSATQQGTFSARDLETLAVDFDAGHAGFQQLRTLNPEIVRANRNLSDLRSIESNCFNVARSYHSFLSAAASLAKDKWTTFNLEQMARGLGFLALVVLLRGIHGLAGFKAPLELVGAMAKAGLGVLLPLHILSFLCPAALSKTILEWEVFLAGVAACGAGFLVLTQSIQTKLTVSGRLERAAGGASSSWLGSLRRLVFSTLRRPASFQFCIALFVCVLYMQGLFGNTFIEHESAVSFWALALLAGSWVEFESRDHRANVRYTILILAAATGMFYCGYSTAPDTGFQDESKFGVFDVALMVGSIVALVVGTVVISLRLLRTVVRESRASGMRLERSGWLAAVPLLVYPLSMLAIMLYWTLQTPLTSGDKPSAGALGPSSVVGTLFRAVLSLSDYQYSWVTRLGLPRIVYLAFVGGVVMLVGCCPHLVPDRSSASAIGKAREVDGEPVRGFSAHDGVARRRRDGAVSTDSAAPDDAVALPSSTASLSYAQSHLFALQSLSLLSLLSLPLMLVWGPKSSVLFLCIDTILLCMTLLSPRTHTGTDPAAAPAATVAAAPLGLPRLSLSELCFLFFLSLHTFYTTNHALSFSSLQVSAAFVGLEEFSYYISGALLGLNTFGGSILGVVMAVVVTAGRQCGARPSPTNEATALGLLGSGTAGAAATQSSSAAALPPFRVVLSSFSYVFALRTVCSVLNVSIQRRHLMVWAIFAPKFIFDAISCAVVEATAMLVAAACTRWANASASGE